MSESGVWVYRHYPDPAPPSLPAFQVVVSEVVSQGVSVGDACV